MAKPQYKRMDEIAPLSEIIPGLFQGMRPRTYQGYDLVVNCEEFFSRAPLEGYTGMFIHIPMRDDDLFVVPDRAIEAAVEAMNVMGDKKILVHCTGGLNRSSLVVGAYLVWKLAYEPQDAVTLMRVKRDPFVLCNRAFERWVLGEQLPTAETSAFRVE